MRQEAPGVPPQEEAIGERKIVTVLFADIVNSTSIITSLDPEDANTTLLHALHAACECIRKYRGTVTQIMGDGVLAVFGAPVSQEDHALRAGLAAQDIHDGREMRSRTLPMRVGLSSGEVVAYGSPGGIYPFIRIIGEPVHLAARMQERARPGSTFLSQATRTFMGGHAETKRAGRYRLAGGTSSDIYQLKRVRATPAAGGRSPFGQDSFAKLIGRDPQLNTLRSSLAAVQAKAGHSILITGEAGIGKSRLVREFVASGAERKASVFRCDFQPAEIAQPLTSFRRLVGRLIRSENGVTRAVRDPLDTAAIAAFLGDASHGLADWRNLEPAQQLDISVRAVTAAIIAASLDRSFIIICEDIHWADTIAGRTVDRLSRDIAGSRILLICTARSTVPIRPVSFTTTIQLPPLSEQATAELVGEFLGNDPSLHELKDTLVRETQGNPYHVEECVAALVESGRLTETSSGAGYLLRQPIGEFIIPGSLRGALAARIDQLEVADRNMLLHAAAIGRTFDTGLLEVITKSSGSMVAAHLNRLQALGLIQQSRLLPSIEYTFTHNLIQEVAYDTLLRQHRKRLHLAILTALSKRTTQQLPAKVELMADHAYRAEEWALAYLYCKRAATRAQVVSRNIEAKGYLFRALHAAEALGSTPQNLRRLAATELKLAPSLFALGQHQAARDHLTESLAAARQLGNTNLEAKISSNIALLHWITGDYGRAIRADRDALRLARQSRNGDQQIASTLRMGMLFCEAGNYTAAETLLRRGLGLIPTSRADEKYGLLGIAAVGARAYLARTYAELGQFQSATNLGDESIELAEGCADPFSRAFANIFTGIVLTRQGEYRRAQPALQNGVALCQRVKLPLLLPLGQACQGYVAWQLDQDRAGARALIERAVRSAAKQKMVARSSLIRSWLAETQAHDGEHREARRHADEALKLARASREHGQEAWALWTLGKIAAPDKGPRSSIAHYAEASKIAQRRGMRPLRAHCELGLSASLQTVGETAHAIKCAGIAKEIYEDIGLQVQAEQSGRRLASLGAHNTKPSIRTRSYSAATS